MSSDKETVRLRAEEMAELFDRDNCCKCQCQNVFFLESQNVQLLEFNVQKNLILIIHLCF